jgi:hypothetical protein
VALFINWKNNMFQGLPQSQAKKDALQSIISHRSLDKASIFTHFEHEQRQYQYGRKSGNTHYKNPFNPFTLSASSSCIMNLYPSSAGVYDEAVEASAERIMLVMQDNVSSGYSSDTDTSEGQETDSCSIADDPSSSSSSSASTCGENESIESEISFLQKKQSLLQRASAAMKREEAYDVSIARDVVNGTVPRGSSLWIEAQEVLDILNCREGKDEAPSKRKTMAASIEVDKIRGPKKPRIDLSSVVCLSSSNFSKIIPSSPPSYKRSPTTMPFTSTGPWMAEALTQSVPSPTQSHDDSLSRWEVVKDPELGLLVVPPSKLPLQSGVELKDALCFTSSAQ